MIIDAYSHGLHGGYLKKLAQIDKNIVADMARVSKECPQFLDIALRVEQLDKYGVDIQLVGPGNRTESNLFPGHADTKLAFAKAVNDNMAKIMEDSKGRLITLGTVPLTGLEAGGVKEMERAIKTLGLKGFMLASNINGKPLDLPEFEPFWAKAAEMNIAVYIHPIDPVSHTGRNYEADYDLAHNFGWPFETTLMLSRLVFSGIMERYPTLKIVSHHLGGGMIPFFWGRILETYEHSKQKKLLGRTMSEPLFNYFSRFYYDTAVGGNAAAIRCAYEVFGADRIIFATDFPYGPGQGEPRLANYPAVVRSLGLSKAENKKIFEDNARRILNI